MKKFFATLLVTWYLATSVVFAVGYPRFWKGDTNYPLVYARTTAFKRSAVYLDKNSVKVKIRDLPYYIITANAICIDYPPPARPNNTENIEIEELNPIRNYTFTYKFFYDEDEIDMREGDKIFSDSQYLRPSGGSMVNIQSMFVGEAIFYVATGKKFYGNYLWKSEYKDRYEDIFKDNYYEDLR